MNKIEIRKCENGFTVIPAFCKGNPVEGKTFVFESYDGLFSYIKHLYGPMGDNSEQIRKAMMT